MPTGPTALVAVLDTSPDFIQILTDILSLEGVRVIGGDVRAFRAGRSDIQAFLTAYHPDVVLYDVAVPYQENWAFFQEVLRASGLKACQFIVVTTNQHALTQWVGTVEGTPIIGKPMDIDTLLATIHTVLTTC